VCKQQQQQSPPPQQQQQQLEVSEQGVEYDAQADDSDAGYSPFERLN
jgi:hypothetical protein